MDSDFNPDTQHLTFKQIYTDRAEMIYVYKGEPHPTYTIDPITCTQQEMQNYWTLGLRHLFDVVDNVTL